MIGNTQLWIFQIVLECRDFRVLLRDKSQISGSLNILSVLIQMSPGERVMKSCCLKIIYTIVLGLLAAYLFSIYQLT